MMRMLPGYAGQMFGNLSEYGDGGKASVDINSTPIGLRDDATDDEPLCRIVPMCLEHSCNTAFRRDFKIGFEFGGVGSGADQLRGRTAAEQQVHGADDNGFSRSGFTGQHRQSV